MPNKKHSHPHKTKARKKSGQDAAEPKKAQTQPERPGGDLQGLSTTDSADSESVAELADEGNAFEADVVAGVEAADADAGEVHTHEVPEDDVPDEYRDDD